MRLLDLTRLAGSSEALRLRLIVRRQISRVLLVLVAGMFALAMLALLEIAAIVALIPLIGLLYAVLAIAGANLVVAGVLFFLASRDTPSRAEVQALEMRNQALASMRSAGVMMTALQWGWRLARRRR